MPVPRLAAWGLCVAGEQVLAQLDTETGLYRLPGGTIEWGETAAETVIRELREEYGLTAEAGEVVSTYEHLFGPHDPEGHDVILLVHFELEHDVPADGIAQRKHPTIVLAWQSLHVLATRRTSPPRLATLVEGRRHTVVDNR